ncbi:MAG: hypothetical protein LQ343_003173 [Gyalolechia ehrenbergii]|nr:MAG: hypothetical protein LQ343_003173 [Gyalolechia ehrenbergii]
MAAPAQKTLKDLNGKWVMNKTLSDDTDRVLQLVLNPRIPTIDRSVLHQVKRRRRERRRRGNKYQEPANSLQQGVSWFMRRAIALASVTLTVKQYEKDGVTHIDCTQVATGGITSIENRTLDWELREDTDKVFGEVKGKSRWVKLKDVDDDDYLKTGYDDLEGEHVQAWTEGKKGGWTANQVWGFEIIQDSVKEDLERSKGKLDFEFWCMLTTVASFETFYPSTQRYIVRLQPIDLGSTPDEKRAVVNNHLRVTTQNVEVELNTPAIRYVNARASASASASLAVSSARSRAARVWPCSNKYPQGA